MKTPKFIYQVLQVQNNFIQRTYFPSLKRAKLFVKYLEYNHSLEGKQEFKPNTYKVLDHEYNDKYYVTIIKIELDYFNYN